MKIVANTICPDYVWLEKKRIGKKSSIIVLNQTEPNYMTGLVLTGELQDKLVLFVNCGTVRINTSGKETFLVPFRDILAEVQPEEDEEVTDFIKHVPTTAEWYGEQHT